MDGSVRRALGAMLLAPVLALALPAVATAQAVVDGSRPAEHVTLAADVADEGVAVVDGRVLTRGRDSTPAALREAGWVHIGDPDVSRATVVDALQGRANSAAKAFLLTTANGADELLVHGLVAGESYHNSFAAVSPDGRWLVAGEWGTMTRLLVFAMPSTAAGGTHTLGLAGVITLRHAVRNVQGCDFASSTQLLCSTDDNSTQLFPVPRQLLSIDLDHALTSRTLGTADPATVRLVNSIPAQDVGQGGPGEVEGIDVTDGVVRVEVNVPGSALTELFTYPRQTQWRAATDIDTMTTWLTLPGA